jgi:hypothetical protein
LDYFGLAYDMVFSSSVLCSRVVGWDAPAPVPALDNHTTADEQAVSSVGTFKDAGEASSTRRQFKWETPVSSTTVGGPPATTVVEISAPAEIPFVASATAEGASRLVTGSE